MLCLRVELRRPRALGQACGTVPEQVRRDHHMPRGAERRAKQLGAVEKCFATVLGILITGAAQEFVLPELRGSHANTSNFLVNSDSANNLARGGEPPRFATPMVTPPKRGPHRR